jgi:hypothetical protein
MHRICDSSRCRCPDLTLAAGLAARLLHADLADWRATTTEDESEGVAIMATARQ